jgi:proline iminopeptidase
VKRYLVFLILITAVCCNEPEVSQGYISIGNGDSLFYSKVGSGNQKIIVPMGLWLFDHFKSMVDSVDCTIVFYDVRNRGRSTSIKDSTTIGIWQDVQDLERIRTYFGFQKVSLIGWSYLGLMVMLYATQYEEYIDEIIQIGAVPLKWDRKYPVNETELSNNIDSFKVLKVSSLYKQNEHLKRPKYFTEEWAKAFVFPNLFGDTTLYKKTESWLLSKVEPKNEWYIHFSKHLKFHFEGSVQQLNADSLCTEIQKLKMPVLTIHGTKDRNAPYGSGKEWAGNLQNATLFTVDGAGHLPWIESPYLVMSQICSFLEKKN